MSQNDRVLAALRRAGRFGITQVDFSLPDVIDGGKPINRVAARINDLGNAGHVIGKRGTRNRCAVYVLKASGVSPTVPAASALDRGAAGTLFDPADTHVPAGAYDEIDEAA